MPDATNGSRGLVPAVTSLAEYERQGGGLTALRNARQRGDGGDILNAVLAARLRGRGGAGMLTAEKWQMVRDAVARRGGPASLVVNAYDADARSLIAVTLLSRQPYLVLEGTILAAMAVGAREAFIYLRSTNRTGADALDAALQQLRDNDLLGALTVAIVGVDVGFMGGEESTMIEVIRGNRAMARQRPPFPAQAGLGEMPTAIMNIETVTQVVAIMQHAPAYQRIDATVSSGTKFVSVYGPDGRGTLVEVPFGTTIAAICQQAGVATQGARGIVVGGPEGGVLPPAQWHVGFDFESLKAVGTIVGSGTIEVLSPATCMVKWSRDRMQTLAAESCGKCIPCRTGTKRMAGTIEGIMSAIGTKKDLELLAEFNAYIAQGSLCGFGWNATHPVITALRYFNDDFQQHLAGECPTGTCIPVRSHRFATKGVL